MYHLIKRLVDIVFTYTYCFIISNIYSYNNNS